jgi:4-hydroxy-3-polyprenylbenzoate decarboxylase
MVYSDLQSIIKALEGSNQFARISEQVSPDLQVTEINDRVVKQQGKALLFENNGTEFPLLLNLYGSEVRMNMVLGTQSLDDIGTRIMKLLHQVTKPSMSFKDKLMMLPMLKEVSSWMPNRSSGRGNCQQEMMQIPDLNRLPIPKCWPFDGGRFITLPMVHTQNPETGVTNVGMYRMQVLDSSTTAMHWHLHKDGARHYEMYKKMGKRMPVSVAIGGDPIFAYCASAPLPENIDEYMLAGFLRHERVRLIKCKTNELYVPADADFILEGYVDPSEELAYEGPFGDHTGYYSLADYYPKFHITCITHRTDAIYPATIVGVPPQEDRWLGKTTERIFLTPVRISVCPDVIDMNLPYQGGFHNLSIVQADIKFPGQPFTVMNALWGAGQMMFNKIMIVVDKDTNPFDSKAVLKCLANVNLNQDVMLSRGAADVLDHAGREFAISGKIGIDATKKTSVLPTRSCDLESLKADFPNMTINTSFFEDCGGLIIGFDKSAECLVRKLTHDLVNKEYFKGLTFIAVFDKMVDLSNDDILLWQISGNIDPQTDCFFVENQMNKSLVIDATSKRSMDGFTREWPNVIAMDDKTIAEIDKKWDKLGLGEFISSPSIQMKTMVKNEGAVAYGVENPTL